MCARAFVYARGVCGSALVCVCGAKGARRDKWEPIRMPKNSIKNSIIDRSCYRRRRLISFVLSRENYY